MTLETEKHVLTRKSGPTGEVDFGTLPAGLYYFTVSTPWGRHGRAVDDSSRRALRTLAPLPGRPNSGGGGVD